MTTKQTIENYLNALKADRYDVRLIHAEPSRPAFKRCWSSQELLKHLPFLKAKNFEGYNIYCRPVGYEFVLVDDVRRPTLDTAATIKPAALIETSPDNFQLWYILPSVPQSREQAKAVCVYLANELNADLASAEPDHIGRLVGFTNRKPKYEHNGLFPFVKLHRWQFRTCTLNLSDFPANGVLVLTQIPQSNAQRKGTIHDNSRSGQDFNLACLLIRKGFDDAYILKRISEKSDKVKEQRNPEKYLLLTVEKARKAVNCA